MAKTLNAEQYLGQQYGCYKIISSEKINNRTYLVGECIHCGTIKKMRPYNFHKLVTTDCYHQKEKKYCLQCGKETSNPKFCSSSCAAKYNKNRILKNKKFCLNCGKEIQNQRKYCSISCQHEYNYKSYINDWKSGKTSGTISDGPSNIIKNYIRKKYNYKCCKCGWGEINPTTGKSPLEIHHKDGDYTNNDENNLELLCPNCHSLTPTYKALNSGKGRSNRYKNVPLV